MQDGSALPLAGVRVISVEQHAAGPWATLQLADLGAEVIKLEDPATAGDPARYVPPYQDGEDSLFFESFNRGKRSVSLDLRLPDSRGVLRDLAMHSDVVFCNLRGDQPTRLGLTHETLRDCNSRIVCCSLSGFGMTGPRAHEGAYDNVIQALSGWMSLTGAPAMPPTKTGLSLVDFASGYVATISILAGLWRARETGEGCQCDVSLFETALAQLNYIGTWVASAGYEPRRTDESAHPSLVPFQSFSTGDGWLTIACPKQHLWERFCRAIGRDDLLLDARYVDLRSRNEHRVPLLAELRATLGQRSATEWAAILQAVGVPASRVRTVAEALDDSQTRAREGVLPVEHPRLGTVRHVAPALRVGTVGAAPTVAPTRGADTLDVLTSVCGYTSERCAALRDAGIFGDVV